jgi:hypothetical protein
VTVGQVHLVLSGWHDILFRAKEIVGVVLALHLDDVILGQLVCGSYEIAFVSSE